MKKFTIVCIAFLLAITSFAQIPNGNFEKWTSKDNGLFNIPDQWSTMNYTTAKDSVFTIEKGMLTKPDTSYYIRIISKALDTAKKTIVNGIAVCGKLDSITRKPKSGFAYSGQPKSFTGKWEFMWMHRSPGLISATLTKWNSVEKKREIIATSIDTLGGMEMSWVPFSFDFSYLSNDMPDSCIIVLEASGSDPGNGDYLFVDSLAFTGTAANVPENARLINHIHIYPNPSSENILLDLDMDQSQNITIQLVDLYGKIVQSKYVQFRQGSNKYNINTESISNGIYLLNIISPENRLTGKIEINR